MTGTITAERERERADGLAAITPLPVWFFAFEGVCGGAYDLCQAWDVAWVAIAALGLVNLVVGFTVLRGRIKLIRAMLKGSRTRKIAFGLIGLRLGLHLLLGVVGAQVTSVAGHVAIAVTMTAATMALLYVDQRITFKALGLRPAPAA
ncbi:hypothetical protein HUT19_19345 [Streptomyces sp. NA02950]|uniref:hypothetical protein n=1 Tax=Streptomyces sp. NA02950 TaxID=2742137 RepID=UPI00158FE516|nr:hypothetical protein [Streptomyces sp. NA02950]QKV93644.1 hypothetical protein HUT19_19345 [Streptomyces sp. NA02950]